MPPSYTALAESSTLITKLSLLNEFRGGTLGMSRIVVVIWGTVTSTSRLMVQTSDGARK